LHEQRHGFPKLRGVKVLWTWEQSS
jgi:hypothetical protein